MSEEAFPEAAATLRDAGWAPHPEWNVYTRGTLVMGGIAGSFHVKDYARIPPGHPLHSADTPDTAEEAAAWLVARFTPAVDLGFDLGGGGFGEAGEGAEYHIEPQREDEFILAAQRGPSLAQEPEQVETPGHDAPHVETERADAAEEPEEWRHDQRHASEGAGERHDVVGDLASGGPGNGDYSSDPIDADFTIEDLGGPDEALELPAPEPEDFAPDEFAPAPEAPQDRFIGLDDLDRVRSLRIGDVATEALRLTTLIEQAVSEQEGEFANIQAYVVSHLDKHTGAFTPQDDASRQTYGRFLELSMARSKIALIDARRKDATAFLIAAGRDEVVGFDVQAAFA